MTQSTQPEAPAEAASDAPTGSPAQPHPTLPEGFGDLDRRAIDVARVLAMDAVQKVGNGHPGTAMSMAPVAYLLFQKWLRHDPSDPNWAARDRFVLSMGHSSLTLYVQLYLSGYGMELDDLKALRTWGSQTPGHPEVNHTPGVETTTGPLGQGVGNAVGMAMAARRERGLLDPDAPEGESLFDHTIWCFASDGDLEEGVSGEASSLAGTQQLGNLVLVYDDNKISIEDDTNVAFTEDVGKRYEAYGWHVQRVDDGEDLAAVDAAFAAAKAETGRPSIIVLKTIIGWPAPNKQNTGAAHGSALGDDEVKATKQVLGLDPEKTFDVAPEVIEHARKVVARGQKEHAAWQDRFDAWKQGNADGAALLERMTTRTLPEGWAEKLPSWDADPKGVATRKASGEVLAALYPAHPRAVGRLGRPGGEQQHRRQGRTVVPPGQPADEDVVRRPLRPHAALRCPRARHGLGHERDRAARRHPRLRRHVPHVLRLHARRRPPGRDHAAAGDLRVDPRLDRPRRGRPDPPADRAPRRAARHPGSGRRPAGRRQRGRRRLADDPGAQRPARRDHPVPAEPPRLRPRRSSPPPRGSPAAATCWPRPRRAPRR